MKTETASLSYSKTLRGLPALAHDYGAKNVSLKATAKLHAIGNQKPYFSVTGDMWRGVEKCTDRNWICGGCLHDYIAEYFPKLKPLIALHLSDEDGTPMHAEANGFYWIAGALGGLELPFHGASGSSAKTADECLRIFAEHCRSEEKEAKAVLDYVQTAFNSGGVGAAKECWASLCNVMRPRWKAEADAGIELLRSLIAEQE